jgi:hypothetical protein
MRNGDGRRRRLPLRGGGGGVSIAANIVGGILAVVAVGAALRASYYWHGYIDGTQRGIQEGRAAADLWWMGLDRQSDHAREALRSNEERWP